MAVIHFMKLTATVVKLSASDVEQEWHCGTVSSLLLSFFCRRNVSRGQNSAVNTTVCSVPATIHMKPLRALNY